MAFRPLPPGIRLHFNGTINDPAITLGSNGRPQLSLDGPDDWARYVVEPEEWANRHRDQEKAAHFAAYAPLFRRQYERLPLGVNAQGEVGYDLDWTLLTCLYSHSSEPLPIKAFREVLKTADPCVAHPSPLGPGGGYPLPLAIARGPVSSLMKLRLLDSLPDEACRVRHQGKGLVDLFVDQLDPKKASSTVLLVWALSKTQEELPLTAKIPTEGFDFNIVGSSRQNLDTMLKSKPVQNVLKPYFQQHKGAIRVADIGNMLTHYLFRMARDARAHQNTESISPERRRLRVRS